MSPLKTLHLHRVTSCYIIPLIMTHNFMLSIQFLTSAYRDWLYFDGRPLGQWENRLQRAVCQSVHPNSQLALSRTLQQTTIAEIHYELLGQAESQHRLRSGTCPRLIVPWTRLSTIGDRSFCVTVARAWNSLPTSITALTSLPSFKRQLKTFLFTKCFPSVEFFSL